MKKIKVAVTGNIGSGKSSFCKFLEEEGYRVIKADDIAKDLMAKDPHIKSNIIKHFGNSAYVGGEVNKKFLAEKVFSDASFLKKINEIVHPAVIKKVDQLMNDHLKTFPIVFHEAALIYEADMEELFDAVVLIKADLNLRMERKKAQSSLSKEEFINRDSNQIPEEEKEKRADFVFTNNESLQSLKFKAGFLINILKAMTEK